MKKMLTKILGITAIFFIVCTNFVQAQDQHIYIDSEASQLRAKINTYKDNDPPTLPVLKTPENGSIIQIPRPTFSWTEATDNKQIDHYTFYLEGVDDGNGGNDSHYNKDFKKEFNLPTQPEENDYYRYWYEDGIYYLLLKTDLPTGKFNWKVSVTDGQNSVTTETWDFKYIINDKCKNENKLGTITWTMPRDKVDTRRPAIVWNYDVNNSQPAKMEVLVDDITVFGDVIIQSQSTPNFVVNVTNGQVSFQPHYDYLKEKIDGKSYKLTLKVTDVVGCEKTIDNRIISFEEKEEEKPDDESDDEGKCTAQALIPILVAPTRDYVSSEKTTHFTWNVCAQLSDIKSQSFSLNGIPLFFLGAENASTNDYAFAVSKSTTPTCSSWLQMSLVLKKTSMVSPDGQRIALTYNDVNNSTDWNRWQISITSCNDITMSSGISRFRYVPGLLGTYHWCDSQQSCQSGSLTECLASGRNCYYGDSATCVLNAVEDCSSNPPVRTYYWCNNQSQCTQGTLRACGNTGKNCFLSASGDGDYSCLSHSQFECNQEAKYYWCTDSCKSGSFRECVASGKPCYRQDSEINHCPARVYNDCDVNMVSIGVLSNTPFGRMMGQIPTFVPSMTDFLAELGLDESIILILESLSTQIFPFVSTILLLPIGLLIIFFPRPRGRVFDSKTRRGVGHALIVVEKEGRFVNARVTSKYGYYQGFKLPPGEYRLLVSTSDYYFPSKLKREDGVWQRNFYLGEYFQIKSEFTHMVTYQIPVDLDQRVQLTPEQERDREKSHPLARWWQFLVATINTLSLLWTISFILVIIFTMIYPIWLNIFILMIYIIGFVRRLLSSLHRANVRGRVYNAKGKPVNNALVRVNLLAFNRLAARTLTNKQGYFEFYLDKEQQYRLLCPEFIFVEENGEQDDILLSFTQQKNLELQLVIKEK